MPKQMGLVLYFIVIYFCDFFLIDFQVFNNQDVNHFLTLSYCLTTMRMHFFLISLLIPLNNAFISTRIHQNSVYRFRSPCAFLRNTTWSNDESIQSCIWECVHTSDCQTAVYFQDQNICSMFSEVCDYGTIEPAGSVSASVICYRKNHLSESHHSCLSTAPTTHSDKDTTTAPSPDSNETSFWPFDNHTLDISAGFDGTPIGNLTYTSPGINGYGSALSLVKSRGQYVEVRHYRNLANRSFTVEMWFYCINLTSYESGLFGQYHYWNISQFLHYQIRNNTPYLGFYGNDVRGSTINLIKNNTWYHVAFVYDFSLLEQKIYLNGRLDNRRNPAQAYQGTSGSITIGKAFSDFSG